MGDGGESSCEATLAAGEEEITLLAQDPANAVGLDSVTVVINTPNAPTLTWLSPQDGDLLTADVPVELAVQLKDDADEPAALALASSLGAGSLAKADEMASMEAQANTAGRRQVGSLWVMVNFSANRGVRPGLTPSPSPQVAWRRTARPESFRP